MGVQDTARPLGSSLVAGAGAAWTWLAASPLQAAATTWAAGSAREGRAQANRQFLAIFAIQLVHQFRVEEDWLRRTRSGQLAQRRRKNHQVARQLQQLMVDLDHGLDVSGAIQALLTVWRAPQAVANGRALPGKVTDQ